MSQSGYWESLYRRKLTRRRFLAGSVVGTVGLGTAAVIGCGKGEEPKATPGTPGAGQPQSGGTIKLAYEFLDDLDPVTDYLFGGFARVGVYSGLLRNSPNTTDFIKTEQVLDLAEQYELADDLTHVFTLRRGVKFHNQPPANGREMTADDVVFSLNRLRDPNIKANLYSDRFSDVNLVEAVDKYTVRIITKSPSAPLPKYLGENFYSAIVLPELVEQKGDLHSVMLGTGPYMFSSWEPGQGFVLTRNPDYFIQGKPYFDGVKEDVITDDAAQLAKFSTGGLNWRRWVPPSVLDSYRQISDVTIASTPMQERMQMRLNLTRKPLDDKRVRQALLLATDQAEYIKIAHKGDGKPSGVLPLSLEFAVPPEDLPSVNKPDVAKAKQLLSAAGYPDGFKLKNLGPSGVPLQSDIAAVGVAQLQRIGVQVENEIVEYAAYSSRLNASVDYEIAIHWGGFFDDVDGFVRMFRSDSKDNAGWGGPELDKLIDQQKQTLDHDKRADILRNIQQIVAEEVYVVPLPHGINWEAYNKEIQNYVPTTGWLASLRRAMLESWWQA
jgi:ABC-type transport system substrate-binding protein